MWDSADVTERELVVYRAHGLIAVDGGLASTASLRQRVRRIRRLHRDLGLTYDVIALVLPLLDRIEELERRRASAARHEETHRAP